MHRALRRCSISLVLFGAASAGFAGEHASLSAAQIKHLTEQLTPQALTLYREFLSLPNDAHFPDDIGHLLDWLEPQFVSRGFSIERLPTAGNPVLLANRPSSGAKRTLLVYLQADGQPVDRAAWSQPDPFVPVLKRQHADASWEIIPWQSLDQEIDPDWRIYARSASDSKGPMTQFLMAMSLLQQAQITPAFNLKVIVDTEEELGSPHLAALVRDRREQLAADMLLIFDGPPHASNRPTVSFGARGLLSMTLVSYGPKVPQHSGHYGNFVPNPAFHLARILGSMKSIDGKVLIPGFYAGVQLDPSTLATLAAVPDDAPQILADMGLSAADLVAPSLQQALQYPSLNIRGMASAWVGEQARTIIPATATAELDIRLVLESDPDRLAALVREHIQGLGYTVLEHPPTDADRATGAHLVSLETHLEYRAFRSDFDSLPGRVARAGMRMLYGSEPILIRSMGGSIPISPFVELLDVPAASVATVNIDNNQHSPNENLRLGNFIEGISIISSVLAQIPD